MKYCKDCKYIEMSITGEQYARCMRQRTASPVTGKLIYSENSNPPVFCYTLRTSRLQELCGPEARFFEEVSDEA